MREIHVNNLMLAHSMPHLGWGDGSGSDNLYQVHLELLNQSVCDNLLGDRGDFDPEVMICAGDAENGGRSPCHVSDQEYVCLVSPEQDVLIQ